MEPNLTLEYADPGWYGLSDIKYYDCLKLNITRCNWTFKNGTGRPSECCSRTVRETLFTSDIASPETIWNQRCKKDYEYYLWVTTVIRNAPLFKVISALKSRRKIADHHLNWHPNIANNSDEMEIQIKDPVSPSKAWQNKNRLRKGVLNTATSYNFLALFVQLAAAFTPTTQ